MSTSVGSSEDLHESIRSHHQEGETMEETLLHLNGGPHPEDVAGIISPEPVDELRAGLESSAEAERRAIRHALRM